MYSDVTTLFNPILIVTRTEVSEDLVYQVTKALLDTHKDDFKAIHPNAALFNIENAGKSMVVPIRSEEHTSELQSLMRISYAVFCLKKKKTNTKNVGKIYKNT